MKRLRDVIQNRLINVVVHSRVLGHGISTPGCSLITFTHGPFGMAIRVEAAHLSSTSSTSLITSRYRHFRDLPCALLKRHLPQSRVCELAIALVRHQLCGQSHLRGCLHEQACTWRLWCYGVRCYAASSWGKRGLCGRSCHIWSCDCQRSRQQWCVRRHQRPRHHTISHRSRPFKVRITAPHRLLTRACSRPDEV